MARRYDVIGDVHGCYHALCRLLTKLGYSPDSGVWSHPNRQAVFVGDILDRGPNIRESYWLVRKMVDAGNARLVLGNHEVAAVALNTRLKSERHLSYALPMSQKYKRQIAETTAQFERYPAEWYSAIAWFAKQPLFIDEPHFRVVHACWDQSAIDMYVQRYKRDLLAMIADSFDPVSPARVSLDRLTRGTDMRLPEGHTITSEEGYVRSFFRTKFWVSNANTYGEVVFQPDPLPDNVASAPISEDNRARLTYYAPQEKPLFVGHYWLRGKPSLLAKNIVCVDYSAVKQGSMAAYRYDEGAELSVDNFVYVSAEEE